MEETIGAQLKAEGVPYRFEKLVLSFLQPAKPRKYTPDFVLLNNGIVLETKGRFLTSDRQKHLLVKQQHPDIDLRFIFSRSKTRISKTSRTTYALWCETNGFKYADVEVPQRWLREPVNVKSLRAIKKLLKESS